MEARVESPSASTKARVVSPSALMAAVRLTRVAWFSAPMAALVSAALCSTVLRVSWASLWFSVNYWIVNYY